MASGQARSSSEKASRPIRGSCPLNPVHDPVKVNREPTWSADLPVVTFVQVGIDLTNATRVSYGHGHRYGEEQVDG